MTSNVIAAAVASVGAAISTVTPSIMRPSTPPAQQQSVQQIIQPVARPPSVPVLQQQQPQPTQQPVSAPIAIQQSPQSTPPLIQPSAVTNSEQQQGFQPTVAQPMAQPAQNAVQQLQAPVGVANGTIEGQVSEIFIWRIIMG